MLTTPDRFIIKNFEKNFQKEKEALVPVRSEDVETFIHHWIDFIRPVMSLNKHKWDEMIKLIEEGMVELNIRMHNMLRGESYER